MSGPLPLKVDVVKRQPSAESPVLTLEDLAGEDPRMLRNVGLARRLADSHVSVLIEGRTGSGKGAFAYAMHLASRRARRPFVAVDCAASAGTPSGMQGKILQSCGGTLFLDQICDMPLWLQESLVGMLQEQETARHASDHSIRMDLHVIAASHRHLPEMVARGAFRPNLYYHLNGVTLELTSLADRADRKRVIRCMLGSETFDGNPAAIRADALMHLLEYPWPGNIRELRNVIRSALAVCEGGIIRVVDLPREIRDCYGVGARTRRVASLVADPTVDRAELLHIMEQCLGNISLAARHLGISRSTFYRKMKTYGIPTRLRC
jgi:transcriptional regulator of acetoin/glycerol metabolism